MTFSIVIPSYNGAKYIEQAIKSALNQTRKADEIIVSDDNSTDETIAICEKYTPDVKIFKNPSGPSGFVNGWKHGIAKASCDYISILHQDDLLLPDFLREAEKAITKYPEAKHIFAPSNYIDGNGNITRLTTFDFKGIKKFAPAEYVDAYLHQGCPRIHRCPGVITHRSVFNVCNYREESGHIADDDFFMRVGNYAEIVGIGNVLAYYREHTDSETGHLPLRNLLKRLIDDYNFQIDHREDNPLLSKSIIKEFKSLQYRYSATIILSSLKHLDLKFAYKGFLYFLQFLQRDIFR